MKQCQARFAAATGRQRNVLNDHAEHGHDHQTVSVSAFRLHGSWGWGVLRLMCQRHMSEVPWAFVYSGLCVVGVSGLHMVVRNV